MKDTVAQLVNLLAEAVILYTKTENYRKIMKKGLDNKSKASIHSNCEVKQNVKR